MVMLQEAPAASQAIRANKVSLRKPVSDDGLSLHRLVAASPPLDPNSLYCNLLQCTHFADTAIAAEAAGHLVGFISGYRLPDSPEVLFVWQVVVDANCRGQGLAGRMLSQLVTQQSSLRFIETTINPGNQPSWRLFEALAADLGAPLETRTLFARDRHFGGEHADEILVRIGPLAS
ncbi:diaminobutyrate acetyltransferase [Cellvibrio polysaccharolyticus]|nr:diaminobutyrate acetyltransferase [Cellvibrio polysaccharolyticus]